MKILVINDPHFSERDKPPAMRNNSYLDDITAKVLECKEIAKDCDLTVFTGDIFHHPRANAVTHSLVSHIVNILKDWPTPIKAIAGNHDLSEAGFRGVQRQPIYVLAESGAIELLHQQGQWLDENTYVMFYSWDNNDLSKYTIKRPNDCKHFILVCHDMLCPDGSYPFDYLSYNNIADITNYDAIFYGHVHWDSGNQKVKNTFFINSGSLSRVAKNEDNINRILRVSVAYIDNTFFDVSFISLKTAKPSDEIFLTAKETSENQSQFADFISRIATTHVDVVDLDSYIVNLPIEEKIKKRIFEYIQ